MGGPTGRGVFDSCPDGRPPSGVHSDTRQLRYVFVSSAASVQGHLFHRCFKVPPTFPKGLKWRTLRSGNK